MSPPRPRAKTHFCKHQAQPDWVDGDSIWGESGADPFPFQWWKDGLHTIQRVSQRCDVITADAVDRGFWIIGSTNYWLQPNAIVVPPRDILIRNIEKRGQADHQYDGGLEKDQFHQLERGIAWLRSKWLPLGVPEFESIERATQGLAERFKDR